MSRLYTLLRDRLASEALNLRFLRRVLEEMIASQEPLSQSARLELRFEKWRRREALKSAEWGWRRYPFEVILEKSQMGSRAEIAFEILYSSTCPASAALARHDLVAQLQKTFGSESWSAQQVTEWLEKFPVATPHAQRSRASIRLEVLSEALIPDWGEFIDRAEKIIGTPVQTAVRREDEQEFARLNGQNLLFCEDAVRRLAEAFKADQRIKSFEVRVEHLESLHPHNAVASLSWPPSN
jgi:GTP cyclohydrolase I